MVAIVSALMKANEANAGRRADIFSKEAEKYFAKTKVSVVSSSSSSCHRSSVGEDRSACVGVNSPHSVVIAL
jgi:hypothetical protein